MKLKILSVQIQKPILAPLMQQSISILLLPLSELNQTIEQELQNNPLLEAEVVDEQELKKYLDYLNSTSQVPSHKESAFDDEDLEELPVACTISLEEHLLKQLHLEISDPLKLQIGELIIGNINEAGYLHASLEEIAKSANITDVTIVEEVLAVIQNLDPIGIASRDLQECLIIQLKNQNSSNSETAIRIIQECFDDLGHKRYPLVARKLAISPEEVKKIAKVIARLEPQPARRYRPLPSNIYIQPDIIVRKDANEEYRVDMNKNGIPLLKINPIYRNLLDQPNVSVEERQYVREKLTDAMNFIKSIQQRGETIMAITKYVVACQKKFLDGVETAPVPMVMREVAEVIERNESTVSRAINNKYIDTPQGLFPLKYFFSQAIFTDSNSHISAEGIKKELLELVEDENKRSPLSDQKIQAHFERKGLRLARRTLSKYRQALRIPPSHLRKG